MQLFEAIKRRQSIREFNKEKVSDDNLKLIIQAAYHAPIGRAAYSRYELVVIKDETIIEELAKKIMQAGILLKHPFFHAPLVIFVTGKANRERLDGCDTGCLIQNMMLAATELGLGSCFLYTISEIINGHPKLLKALNLPEGNSVMSAVVFGHPEQKDPPNKDRPGIKTTIV